MPVTFAVSTQIKPKEVLMGEDVGPEQILRAITLKPYGSPQEHPLLWSSFIEEERCRLKPHTNGFIETVLLACAHHHNLRIRPDDVWIAILTQLSAYFYAHAEIRDHFVTAEGKKDVVIGEGRRTRRRAPTGPELLSHELEKSIRTNAADSTSAEWILPGFTTTTQDDTIICSVLMLSKPRPTCNHFAYVDMRWGIPNITLDGSKPDWQDILRRLDRLYELGNEPSVWAAMLRPILRRFVSAFDGEVDGHFWEHIIYLPIDPFEVLVVNGWITAFSVWNFFGEWQGDPLPGEIPRPPPRKMDAKRRVGTRLKKFFRRRRSSCSDDFDGDVNREDGKQPDNAASGSVVEHGAGKWGARYTLDGVPYFAVECGSFPEYFCDVDVTVMNQGEKVACKIVAGHVAVEGLLPQGESGISDTMAPSAQWFVFERRG